LPVIGYDRAGIGSEVLVGVGIIGAVALQGRPMRIGKLRHMIGYGRAIKESIDPGEGTKEIALPGLRTVASQVAAPATVANRLLGVPGSGERTVGYFHRRGRELLTVLAHVVASAIELDCGAGRTPTTPLTSQPDHGAGSVEHG
jgi:adenylate cyclase